MKPLALLIGTFVAGVLLILGAWVTVDDITDGDDCSQPLCGGVQP